ncbi:MAG: molecular chaperone TorD family protein [Acidobacteriota bacterium]|nr:MAG: molecular chaperone TorD family protein [Acidobacteriota bacterium]
MSGLNKRQAELMKEAAEWRLLGLLFECPSEKWKEELQRLANETADPKLAEAARLAADEGAEGIYHSTFGPGGPAPAREISYRSWAQPGYMISELSAYYGAFGFSPKTDETPDHISVEASFVSYLKMKEAFALASGHTGRAEITSRASEGFIRDHVSKVAERLSRSLSRSGIGYLSKAGEILFERVGPDPDRSGNRGFLPVALADDESLDCGPGI